MKKLTFAISLLFSILILGCKKDDATGTGAKTATLGIDVQSLFHNELVQVYIDGKLQLSRPLQTNLAVGYCTDGGRITTTQGTGSHELKAVVNNNASLAETFMISGDHYVGINYDSATNRVWFVEQDEPFLYH